MFGVMGRRESLTTLAFIGSKGPQELSMAARRRPWKLAPPRLVAQSTAG